MIFRTAILFYLTLLSTTHAFGMKGWGPSSFTNISSSRNNKSKIQATIENNSKDESSVKNVKTCDILSLQSIRSTLIRQEETIIFALIERSQYRQNNKVYLKGEAGFGDLGLPIGVDPDCNFVTSSEPYSFLDYMIIGTEILHCSVRRYTSPQEYPFFPQCLPVGPNAALPRLEYPDDLLSPKGGADEINFNRILLEKYINWVVPSIAKSGDDEQHGSTVCADIVVLQALSKRVHYGKFVAESKYRSDPEGYQRLVDNNDPDGVMELLTNAAVEETVLKRAKLKATTYGRQPLMTELPEGDLECSDTTSFVAAAAASAVASAFEALGPRDDDGKKEIVTGKVDPAVIEDIYRKFIIPLTKDIEVAYLFRRCGKEPPAEYGPDRMSTDLMSGGSSS